MNKFKQFSYAIAKPLVVTSLVFGSVNFANVVFAQDWHVHDENSFFNAISSSKAGDNVILDNDITSKNYGTTGLRPINLNGITLDGNNHKLKLVSMPFYLKDNSTIKNINLALLNTTKIDFDFNSVSLDDGGMPIYANGHDLTLDNVNTRVEGFRNYQPTLYMGGDANSSQSDKDNTLTIINSPEYKKIESDQTWNGTLFKKIVAGSNGVEKKGKSTIILDENTRVVGNAHGVEPALGKSTIILKNEGSGFEDKPLNVDVVNSSRWIAGYDQGANTNLKLELKDNEMFTPIRTNADNTIEELKVTGNSKLQIGEKPLTVGKLVLESEDGKTPATVEIDHAYAKFKVDDLVSKAGSVIKKVSNGATMAITKIEGEVKLEGNTNNVTMPANYKADSNGVYKPTPESQPAPSENEEPPAQPQPPSEPQPKPGDPSPAPTDPPATGETAGTPEKEDAGADQPSNQPENSGEGTGTGVTAPEGEVNNDHSSEAENSGAGGEASGTPTEGTGTEGTGSAETESPNVNTGTEGNNVDHPNDKDEVENGDTHENEIGTGTEATPQPPAAGDTDEKPAEEHPADPPSSDVATSGNPNAGATTPEGEPNHDAAADPEKEHADDPAAGEDNHVDAPVVDNHDNTVTDTNQPTTEDGSTSSEPSGTGEEEHVNSPENGAPEGGSETSTPSETPSQPPVAPAEDVVLPNTSESADGNGANPVQPQPEVQPQPNPSTNQPADSQPPAAHQPTAPQPNDPPASQPVDDEAKLLEIAKEIENIHDGYFDIFTGNVPAKVNELSNEAMATRSLAAALSNLDGFISNPDTKTNITAGIGSYGNSKAYAIGLSNFGNFRSVIHGNIAFGASGSNRAMANIGIIWKSGKMNNSKDNFGRTTSRKIEVISSTLNTLEQRMNALNKELDEALN